MRVVVIGLGLFGTSVAEAIAKSGEEVLAVDISETLVQSTVDGGVITHAACVDSTNRSALERLGVGPDYKVGVIGIGTNMEASVITAIHLKDLGVPKVIAKALNATHRKILEKVGADQTLIPEVLSGKAAARQILDPTVLEEMELSEDFTILEIEAPPPLTGKTISDSGLRENFGANVIGYRRSGNVVFVVPPDHILEPDDVLIVGVPKANRKKLLQMSEARA